VRVYASVGSTQQKGNVVATTLQLLMRAGARCKGIMLFCTRAVSLCMQRPCGGALQVSQAQETFEQGNLM